MEHILIEKAAQHVGDMVVHALEHVPNQDALVVYDTDCELTNILTEAYRRALPQATFLEFGTHTKQEIISAFDALRPRDLVVLIQSSSFRLDEFRIRLHLFDHGLKVIEHTHLYRNSPDTWETYIDSLAYDASWYRTVGPNLACRLESANELRILSKNAELVVTGGLETPKLNIGDYTGMKNVGGTFPIGEVFTEARDFLQMNGSVMLDCFAGSDFCVQMFPAFRVEIHEGLVTSWDSSAPEAFGTIIHAIRERERPLVREIGFGLNRAITRTRYMQDITAFERILGIHLSLGEKHSVYKKPGITSDKCRFHVDVFPVVEQVLVDGVPIYLDGTYQV